MSEPLTSDRALPRSLWLYSLTVALLALSPTLVAMMLQMAVNLYHHINPMVAGYKVQAPGTMEIVGDLGIAPLLETAVLAAGVLLLQKLGLSRVPLSLLAALAWGLVHGYLQGWVKILPSAWGFFFFAWAFQVWQPASLLKACLAAWLPHVFVNAALLGVVFGYALI